MVGDRPPHRADDVVVLSFVHRSCLKSCGKLYPLIGMCAKRDAVVAGRKGCNWSTTNLKCPFVYKDNIPLAEWGNVIVVTLTLD